MNEDREWDNPTRYTAKCLTPDCPHNEEQEFGGKSAARRFAKEHVKHTAHKVVTEVLEQTIYGGD